MRNVKQVAGGLLVLIKDLDGPSKVSSLETASLQIDLMLAMKLT